MTMIGNTTSLIASIQALFVNNNDKSIVMKGIKLVSNILFEFSFGMQIMIVVVYWTVIHA